MWIKVIIKTISLVWNLRIINSICRKITFKVVGVFFGIVKTINPIGIRTHDIKIRLIIL